MDQVQEPKGHLHPIPSRNYSEFVSDLQDRLETTYLDVRQSLQVAQYPQKDYTMGTLDTRSFKLEI